MVKPTIHVTLVLLVMSAVIEHTSAQSPSAPPASAFPSTSVLKKKAAPPAAPSIAGNWIGQLNQEGGTGPYTFEISITAKGGEAKYPDLNCIGQLTRAAHIKSYVFFLETITKGRADQGGRCPDGTITVAPLGDKLALSWFGIAQDEIVVASGTLSKR
jgi:hypothetical protein